MDGINKFNQFIGLHKAQLVASGIPQHFWKSLYYKLTREIFDAGQKLQLMLIDYEDPDCNSGNEEDSGDDHCKNNSKELESQSTQDKSLTGCEKYPVFTLVVASEQGIQANDPSAIYLVDHAWTFRWQMARQQLEQLPELVERMSRITGVDPEDAERVNKVLNSIWKYCQSYSVFTQDFTVEERMPIWYVMDEVGSAVNHSDKPNFRLVPFLFLNTQTTYSLLFPVRDCDQGDQVTRDFVEFVDKETPERDALLLPWRTLDLTHIRYEQVEPEEEYFTSGHILETYAKGEISKPQFNRSAPLRVYAEYEVVRENLNDPHFQLVDNEEEADILWLTRHFKSFEELSLNTPNKFINQFPFEYVITVKDILAVVCRRAAACGVKEQRHNALETKPVWLPTTYNLKTELLQFVSYYQHRKAAGMNNHWIIKPWNLARGLDTHITDCLAHIVRLPATGPKIAQKYIDRPVLFYREDIDAKVKFDIRYILLLKSVQPLEAYLHRKFYLRFSNKTFSLDHFDDYEKHFTVMNYENEVDLYHLKCEDFLNFWQTQYPNNPWNAIENVICQMMHEMLTCATQKCPPCGIAACPQSRALYAADIILEWTKMETMQPKLLELNWTPDCKRACDYYPEFFNDIFKLLFLDEISDESFIMLTRQH